MSSFNIEVKGLNAVLGKMNNLTKEVEQTLQDELNNFGQETVNEAKTLCPVDEGFLRNSITYDSEKLSVTIVVAANYAAYVEFGTRKFAAEYVATLPLEWEQFASQFKGGTGGTFQEMLLRITDWVKRKGIDQNAAYVIARKIMINGTKPQPFLVPAVEHQRVELIKNLQNIFQ